MKTSDKIFLRWTKVERIQHWALAGSFIMLVVTGFALMNPSSWWARPFMYSGDIDLRGILHRIAATVNIACALFHSSYLIFTRRGRQQLKALVPKMQDLIDAKNVVLSNLGKKSPHPIYGHFTYWEKIEYWALIWGTMVMVVTGLMLWFENISLQFVPLWGLRIATTIHYYEAILATFSIIIWHFYFVIANPRVYPINYSMFNGYITEEEMEYEHNGELDAIKSGKPEVIVEGE